MKFPCMEMTFPCMKMTFPCMKMKFPCMKMRFPCMKMKVLPRKISMGENSLHEIVHSSMTMNISWAKKSSQKVFMPHFFRRGLFCKDPF